MTPVNVNFMGRQGEANFSQYSRAVVGDEMHNIVFIDRLYVPVTMILGPVFGFLAVLERER